jgi:hypothetical protein
MFAQTGQNRIVPIRWSGLAGVIFACAAYSSLQLFTRPSRAQLDAYKNDDDIDNETQSR